MAIGGFSVIGSPGDVGRDINHSIHQRCHVATTAQTAAAADFVLMPNGKRSWDLKDKAGATVFTTSARREGNIAKDVCSYFGRPR